MPDRDKETQSERNRRTLLHTRLPDNGLKWRVEEAAKQAGKSVSAFVTAALEKALAATSEEEKDS